MSRPVVPVRDLAMRLPDAGRIRIGTSERAVSSKGKEFDRPVKLDRFRFTSSDPAALQQVADLYGGTVQPWKHAKAAAGQFEVVTDAREIRIALPPDPLGNTPIYEMWEGGGCQRRCDGETCEILVDAPDGIDLQQVPCRCDAKGVLECKITTHLSVLLPEIRFVGVWRLTTHGWNAAQELPGMVELIRQLQDRGIVRGLLRVEAREQTFAGKTREYMVPVLGIDETVEALATGRARLGQLAQAPEAIAELEAGEGPDREAGRQVDPDGSASTPPEALVDAAGPVPTSPAPGSVTADDDIIEAEIVPNGDDRDRLVALADTAPKRSKALIAARTAAEKAGLTPPDSFDDIAGELVTAGLAAIGGRR